MKVAIAQFLGTNCDFDTKRACDFFGWNTKFINASENIKEDFDIIFLPGGFSYGDYTGAGRLAKLTPLVKTLPIGKTLIVGICNGFQILCEAGILDGALLQNKSGKFICEHSHFDFLDEELVMPVAHHSGRYFSAKKPENIFLKYKNNINGSCFNVAGIYNKKKKIIGMMPHPERAVFKETGLTDGRKIFEFIENEAKR